MSLTGDKVTALDTSSSIQDTSGTLTSTTYTSTLTGGTACGLAFIAPASGKVLIHNSAWISNNTSFTYATIRVRTGGTIGSGTDVLADSDNRAILSFSPNAITKTFLLIGLTPGSTYNVQGRYRVDAGTGTILAKEIIVEPQP